MGLNDVSYSIALGAGFLSFFSPCLLPLMPVYIMYITNVSIENELKKKKLLALSRALGFVIGFTLIFMIMGTSASFLGKILIRNKIVFTKISGLLIIFFGLNMLGVIKLKFLNMEKRFKVNERINNWFGSIIMGMAFAAGWSPCFGPVLASILVYAGATATLSKGISLLLMYSIGMAIPFILTAVFINSFSIIISKSGKYTSYIHKISGVIMILFGILVFFDKIVNISRLLI
ncbi:cytochrome c biogenesis protein CcdA [Clostridium sediminicola]|uniref:cytochrome c biogenesis CcdA family protein n=1 Tax=Clostridium sediminicola TaxID=3114879 RepID=UPI0031F1E469